MKKRTRRITALMAGFLGITLALSGCGSGNSYIPDKKIEGSTLCVTRVDNMPDGFILGMDASCVPAEERSGVKFYGFDGQEQDVFRTLAENGINYIRVRIWNDPYDSEGNGYGGGNCDLENAVEIGQRATKYGMNLLVNFHYSDFWADPGKQAAPKAWKDMDIETKATALYDYTVSSLTALREAGVDVGMVQIGNETNGTFCGEKIWFNMQQLFSAGSRAVREVFPEALVALHFANPEKVTNYADYSKKLAYYNVDYDVFASSYYPYWHGTLDNLADVLSEIAVKYDKDVMVMETSYAYTPDDSDYYANTISDGGNVSKPYPYTVQGQANSVRDIIDTMVNRTERGIGVVYWEGTWIAAGGNSYDENLAIWEKYGTGWASSFAKQYDPNDAGRYYGGNAVDNQAFFDAEGKPIESLRVFNLVRYGNDGEIKADALDDVNLILDLNGDIELPATVDAVMTDNSRSAVPVTWDADEALFEKMRSGGPKKYEITGEAGGMTAKCYVSMVEYNFLTNYSFEDGTADGWKCEEFGHADELYVEKKPTDSMTGDYHYHFWSAAQDTVEFELTQDVSGLKAGTYKFSISIMGGDSGTYEVYAFVRINGETVGTAPMKITSYGNWDTGCVDGFRVDEGDDVTVGIYVRCKGAGNGAWGKIDDGMLNSVAE